MLQTEILSTWLEDAAGAESALLDVMETQLADLTGQDEMEDKYLKFLDQLHRHSNLLQERAGRLRGETSSLNKGGLSTFINTMKDLWERPTSSRLVKHSIVDVAALHFEIAQVGAIAAAAREIGDEETLRVCQGILREKREMADWIEGYQPQLVHQLTKTLDGGEDTSEDEQRKKTEGSGTLQKRHLYAVSDDDDKARELERALKDAGVGGVERFQGRPAATALSQEAQGPTSLVQKAVRSVKGISGEAQQADHFATQVENGRIVLSIPCDDWGTAEKLMGIIREHGGYDMSYLSDAYIESVD